MHSGQHWGRYRLALFLVCLLFVVHRALVLHTNFDSVSIPNYELMPMGAIAEILHGGVGEGWKGVPMEDFYDNCGGHIVTGILAAPLYSAFGSSYLVLKLVPLLLGLGCVLLVAAIGRRLFGPRLGILAAFLFVAGPTTLVKYSLLAKGNHFENIFFQLLVVYAFVRFHDGGRRSFWLILFGLTAGFAVFFYLGALLLVLLLVSTHWAIRFDWRLTLKAWVRPLRDALYWVPAFLIGLAPILWFEGQNQTPSTHWRSKFGSSGRWEGFAEQVRELFGVQFPRATAFEDLGPISGRLGDGVYLALFCIAWVIGCIGLLGGWRKFMEARMQPSPDAQAVRFRHLKLAPFLGFLPFFALALGGSSFRFDEYLPPVKIGQYRYLVPHFALVPFLIVGAIEILRRCRLGALGGGLKYGSIALALFLVPLVDWSFAHTGQGLRYAGTHWTYYNNPLLRHVELNEATGKYTCDFAAAATNLDEFPRHAQIEILQGAGQRIGLLQSIPGFVDGALVSPSEFDIDALPNELMRQEWRPDLVRGMGAYLRRPTNHQDRGKGKLRAKLESLAASGNPLVPYVLEGLSMEFAFPLDRKLVADVKKSASLEREIPEGFLGPWWRGMGMQMGLALGRGPRGHAEFLKERIAAVPRGYANEFWCGVGFGVGQGGLAPDGEAAWMAWVPAFHRTDFWQGVGAAWLHFYGSEASAPVLWKGIDRDAEKAIKVGLAWPEYPEPYRLMALD